MDLKIIIFYLTSVTMVLCKINETQIPVKNE